MCCLFVVWPQSLWGFDVHDNLAELLCCLLDTIQGPGLQTQCHFRRSHSHRENGSSNSNILVDKILRDFKIPYIF
jgi:hypothetical protein